VLLTFLAITEKKLLLEHISFTVNLISQASSIRKCNKLGYGVAIITSVQ